MKNLRQIFPLTVLILLAFPHLLSAGQFRIIRVYDGDTVRARGHDITIKVSLAGIDAPESPKKKRDPGQPFCAKATEYLRNLVLFKTVEIKGYGLDRYNRIMGVLFVDYKNINLEMVKAGFAEADKGKPPVGFDPSAYRKAEAEASASGRGMWSLGDKYLSPKRWREIQRSK